MTQCKNCAHKSDCWIRQTITFKRPMPNSERDQEICISASLGSCCMFDDVRCL